MHKEVKFKDPLVSWLSNSHNSGNFYPNEKNKTSKSKLGSYFLKIKIISKIKQNSFVLLVIKRMTFLRHLGINRSKLDCCDLRLFVGTLDLYENVFPGYACSKNWSKTTLFEYLTVAVKNSWVFLFVDANWNKNNCFKVIKSTYLDVFTTIDIHIQITDMV